jgi:hypothetical protein
MSSKAKIMLACAVAVLADLLQVVFFPFFIEGAASPVDDVVDVAVAGILTGLLGWNWAFLPTTVAKLLPVVDVAPFWTMAVFYVVWKKGKAPTTISGQPETVPPLLLPKAQK